MPDLNCIKDALATTGWNKARIAFIACLLSALLTVQSVCLTRLATVLPSGAKTASIYRRLQRFLSGFTFEEATLAHLLARIANVPTPWVLALDRTEWRLGKTTINILMLAVVSGKSAFPLLWSVLERDGIGKAGASHTDERIALMERFVALFGGESVAYLCADREFVSRTWLTWLIDHKISFRLRLRSDTLIEAEDGKPACADWLFARGGTGVEKSLSGKRRVLGHDLFVRGRRSFQAGKADFMIVLSDQEFTLSDYALRWGIETLFGAFKSRGFDLEATHVTCPSRLSCLLGVLSIAYCWAFAAGHWLCQVSPQKVKKHGRLPMSPVRRGLDWLRPVALQLCATVNKSDWLQARRFLSCT